MPRLYVFDYEWFKDRCEFYTKNECLLEGDKECTEDMCPILKELQEVNNGAM